MTDPVLVVTLVALFVFQTSWCVYYTTQYEWRSTPMGSVWLAKGSALAVLWPLLAIDQKWNVPDWIFAYLIGPAILISTTRWLWVTVKVRRAMDRRPDRPSTRRH